MGWRVGGSADVGGLVVDTSARALSWRLSVKGVGLVLGLGLEGVEVRGSGCRQLGRGNNKEKQPTECHDALLPLLLGFSEPGRSMLREFLQERFLPRHQELRVLLEDCALDKFLYGHCEFVNMLRVSYVDGI